MNWDTTIHHMRKRIVAAAALLVVLASGIRAEAYTQAVFAPVQEALTNEISSLQADGSLAAQRRARTLQRVYAVFNNSATTDGRVLRTLATSLRGAANSAYTPLVEDAGAMLVTNFNKSYQFVGSLLPEIPDAKKAQKAATQFAALAPIAMRLNAAGRADRVSALLDSANARVSKVLDYISAALVVPFPGTLLRNSIAAEVNGVNFRSSAQLASENVFSATVTESNIIVDVHAVDGTVSSSTGARALTFSIPSVLPGTARYAVPDAAIVFYQTNLYTSNVMEVPATAGSIFVSAVGDEIFGIFTATGEGLNVVNGRFRVTVHNAPATSEE